MKIYFVRHGESMYNPLRLHQTAEIQLSEYGIQQARLVAKRFEHIPVDIILSSGYARAKQTAEAIQAVVKKDIEFNPLLRELKRPSDIEHLSFDDAKSTEIRKQMKKNLHDSAWHYSDEENLHDFRKRAQDFLEHLSVRKEESLAIVSHGLLIRMIVGLMVFGEDFTVTIYERTEHHLKLKNTGITLCERDEKGTYRLVTWNDHAHLG